MYPRSSPNPFEASRFAWLKLGEATSVHPSTNNANARHFVADSEVPRISTENPAVYQKNKVLIHCKLHKDDYSEYF